MDKHRRAIVASGLIGLVLAVGLAGCGGGGTESGLPKASIVKTSASGHPGKEEINPEDAMIKYVECLNENGVEAELDQGEVSSSSDSKEAYERAAKACDGLLTGPDDRTPAQIEEERAEILAHAACMREKGHDFPDPILTDGRYSYGDYDNSGPTFEKDYEACWPEGTGDGGTEKPSDGQ